MIPRIVSNAIVIPVGSWSDTKGLPGIAHYVEHYVSKISRKQLNGVSLASYLSQLGCDLNFFTMYDRTVFQVTCLEEQQQFVISCLQECLFDPVVEEEDLSGDWFVERRLLEQELYLDGGEYQPTKLLWKHLFGARSPYARPSNGQFSTLKKVAPIDLFHFWKTHYVKTHSAIVSCDGNRRTILPAHFKLKHPRYSLNSSRLVVVNRPEWDTFSLTVYVFPYSVYGRGKEAKLLFKLISYIWDACFHRMKITEGIINDCHSIYHSSPLRVSLWLSGSMNRLDEILERFYEYMIDHTEFLSLELILEALRSMQLHFVSTIQSPEAYVYSVANGYHWHPMEELSTVQKWLMSPTSILESAREFFTHWHAIPKIAFLAGDLSERDPSRLLALQLGSLFYE